MAETASKFRFVPQPLKVGTEWQVIAHYGDGREEHITGFKSETEALNWIGGSACYAWLKERGLVE